MVRKYVWFILAMAILVVVAVMGRNLIAGNLAEVWITRELGVSASMGGFKFGIGLNRFEIYDLILRSKDPEVVTKIASVTAQIDPLGLFAGRLNLDAMELVITEAVMVEERDQRYRLMHFTSEHSEKVTISRVKWSLQRVKLIDKRGAKPRMQLVQLGLKDKTASQVGTVDHLETIIKSEILKTNVFQQRTSPKPTGSAQTSGKFKNSVRRTTDKVKTFFRRAFKK